MIERILESYKDGSEISIISLKHNIPEDNIYKFLKEFRDKSKVGKAFTDDFKKIIASRDSNGVSRSKISKELSINVNTVKKACEMFGKASKNSDDDDDANLYVKIDGEFDMKICPSCNSRKNNKVDKNTTYCMDCGSEHVYFEKHVMKVKFENIN